MSSAGFQRQLWGAFHGWWREESRQKGIAIASLSVAHHLWDFARDSSPGRRRQRYGDMDYDWEHRVNTTSGTVTWRDRLLGMFYSPYQPTEPALFQEMMASLPIDFREFTFVDLGSGKGRTLLMASEYPFRKIIGVEILPELHASAVQNIRDYKSPTQQCRHIESIAGNAAEYTLPSGPLVLYLFNPLPESAFRQAIRSLQQSRTVDPTPLWIVYHSPLLKRILADAGFLIRVGGTEQFEIWRSERND